jgi:hypothetical protein
MDSLQFQIERPEELVAVPKSVPKAENGAIGRAWRCRTRELGTQRSNGLRVARHPAPIGTRCPFLGIDQRRQPQALRAGRSPSLNLLTHACPHDSLTVRYKQQLGKRQLVPSRSPNQPATKKITDDVICFTV